MNTKEALALWTSNDGETAKAIENAIDTADGYCDENRREYADWYPVGNYVFNEEDGKLEVEVIWELTFEGQDNLISSENLYEVNDFDEDEAPTEVEAEEIASTLNEGTTEWVAAHHFWEGGDEARANYEASVRQAIADDETIPDEAAELIEFTHKFAAPLNLFTADYVAGVWEDLYGN